jgi:hypothetical protein
MIRGCYSPRLCHLSEHSDTYFLSSTEVRWLLRWEKEPITEQWEYKPSNPSEYWYETKSAEESELPTIMNFQLNEGDGGYLIESRIQF